MFMHNKKGLLKLSICCLFSFFVINAFAQTHKKLKTIIVDAGHGGTDGGATGQYENSLRGQYENSLRSKEKDVTLAISKKLIAELKKQMPDVNVV